MRSTGALVTVLALGAVATATAQPVTVTAAVTPAEVTVGQTFTLELRVSAPAGTSVTFPSGVAEEGIELAPLPGTDPLVARYHGRCFVLRECTVPPLVVRYRLPDGSEGETQTAATSLPIVSLLPRGEESPALAEIRPPVSLPVSALFIGVAAVVAAAAAATAALLLRRRLGQAAPAAAPPPMPPDLEALDALAQLQHSALADHGEFKAFYVALVEILKRYLERRLDAPVLEMTTTEMVAFLRRHRHGADLAGAAREVATRGDHVKFACAAALRTEADAHLQKVRDLVTTLEARLAEPPATEAQTLRRTA